MKIGFFSPYLDSLAGGERYVLTLVSHWSKKHDVSLFWDDANITQLASKRLGIDLSRVKTVENVFSTRNIFKKMIVSRGYDLLFFLTDGSIPTTFAKYNILHFQVPFRHIPVHPIKLSRFQAVVCNSDFTKRNIDRRLGARSVVIYPPVAPIKKSSVKKRKIILSVGRFHPLKKQDVLIEAFRKVSGYELVLAGGLLPSEELYFKRLRRAAKKLSVRILPNISFEKLSELYNSAEVYWHAAGYRETNPERMEHFGITTVEAMSAGAIPVVYNGGGLTEIVREGKDGYLWTTTEELIRKTTKAIHEKTALAVQRRAQQFSEKIFAASFDKLLATITK